MRKHTYNNISVSYPDEHCYVFNPAPIEVIGAAEGQKVFITVGDKMVTAATFNGKATFNIAEVLQALFDMRKLSIVDTSKEVQVASTAAAVTVSIPLAQLTFTTLAVWGALQTDMGIMISGDFNYDYSSDFFIGRLSNPMQNIVWYPHLPFTLSVPMFKDDFIAMSINGSEAVMLYTADNHQIANISPAVILDRLSLPLTSTIVFTLQNTTTFKRIYTLYPIIDAQGLYLRWIDKKGYYNYWLFEKGADSFVTDKYGAFLNSYTRSIDYVDGFNGGDGRQQGKKASRMLEIAAPMVTSDVWSYLLGITQSPIVDLYADNDYLGEPRFLKVDVATGRIGRENRELSDFVTSITLPQYSNQTL